MDRWRSAERGQERRLWSTLAAVGAVLVLTLVASLLLTAGSSGDDVSGVFYLQQAVLLVLSFVGTVVALRRRRAVREQ